MSGALSVAAMAAEIDAWNDLSPEPESEIPSEKKSVARERGHRERDELRDRLISEDAIDLAKKLDGCGAPLGLVCSHCGTKKSVEIACKRRWCPACAWVVQRERLRRFEVAVGLMEWPLFVTLTMRNTGDPECIREIRGHWSKMRRRKLIVDRILGGVSTIEITNIGNGWHPHLHILCDCKWLALHTPPPNRRDSKDVKRQKYDHARLELSALWSNVIGQETATVSALRKKPGECLKYAMKYAVKGSELIASPDPVAPLIRVMSKSRMVSAFGNLHGKIGEEPEEEKPACLCPDCGQEKTWVPQDVEHYARRQAYDKNHCIR